MRDTPPTTPASTRRARATIAAGPVPDRARLREAALAHLARFPASEAGLVQVLDRRIRRWAGRAAEEGTEPELVETHRLAARQAARTVAAELVASGVLDDAAYAEARARSLTRSGRSRRATLAHLAGRGVDADLAQSTLPEDRERELAVALVQAKRRRIGPFAPDQGEDPAAEEADPALRHKALAALARAGFSLDVAERALGLDRDAAEALIAALRRG